MMLALDRSQELLEKGKTDKTTVVEYTVFVYYTEEFARATTDVKVWLHSFPVALQLMNILLMT